MALIVKDSFDLSGQNPTVQEKLARAETWARVLFGIVPEEMLQKSFDRAFRNHTTSYVVTAYDLKTAYEEIKSEQATLKSQLPQTGYERQAYCHNFDNHLRGKPEILVHIPGITDGDVIMPCGGCRPEEFWQTKTAIIGKHKEADVIDGIEIFKKGKDAA